MDFSNPSKYKLRYFSISISNPNFYLNYLKTLISPSPFSNFNHFHSKPTNPSYPFFSSTGSSSICSVTKPFSQSSHLNTCNAYRNQMFKRTLFASQIYCRHISSSRVVGFSGNFQLSNKVIDSFKPYESPKQVSEILQWIKDDDSELESKLNLMDASLSVASLIEIFRVLNVEKVSVLRFFKWIKDVQPQFYKNHDLCSLAIDNCGRLDDYEAMRCLLEEFSVRQVCLTENAFGFLPVMISSKASTKKCIWRVVELLNEVGGSSRVSGVRALIEVFSVLGSFEMAKYVIKKTERRVSYYNILIREMCRKCDFRGAGDILDEMRRIGCVPNTQSYNYILSSLCKIGKDAEAVKMFEEMQENCPPDTLTYEIFIYNSCRLGKFSVAFQFFDDMVVRGLEPRLATHAAFIKGYFCMQRYEEAYQYVVGSADKYKSSSNMMYSLLAGLHDKNRNPVVAKNILLEMINKGLKPNFSIYTRVLKHLQMSGREEMASSLTSTFSSLSSRSSKEAG